MRLRRGKSRPRGSHSIGISETTAPVSTIRSISGTASPRIRLAVAAGEHADRAGLEARDMGALVDPPRQARDDDVAGLAQAARQPLGEHEPRGGGVAGADDRHRRCPQRLRAPAERENRRRGIDLPQQRRVVRLAERDEAHAELARGDELALDVLGRGDPDRAARAAAPGEIRQRLQRRARSAAIGDERAKGARSDILRPEQPQPVEALLVGKARLGRVRHRL